mgnify:CR=1 FL=1
MNVNTVTPVYEDSQKNVVSMELVSGEFLLNEMGDTRLRSRFNGKVSEHIKQILITVHIRELVAKARF